LRRVPPRGSLPSPPQSLIQRAQHVVVHTAREALREACAKAGLKLQFDNERDPTAVVGVQR
jgi:hypothetical protein